MHADERCSGEHPNDKIRVVYPAISVLPYRPWKAGFEAASLLYDSSSLNVSTCLKHPRPTTWTTTLPYIYKNTVYWLVCSQSKMSWHTRLYEPLRPHLPMNTFVDTRVCRGGGERFRTDPVSDGVFTIPSCETQWGTELGSAYTEGRFWRTQQALNLCYRQPRIQNLREFAWQLFDHHWWPKDRHIWWKLLLSETLKSSAT